MTEFIAPLLALWAAAALGLLTLLALRRDRRRARKHDPQRLFSPRQKYVIAMRAGGRCEHKPLLWRRCPAPGTEADHIVPWSRGGRTVLENAQLLCHRHNARKGAHMPGLLYTRLLHHRRKGYRND